PRSRARTPGRCCSASTIIGSDAPPVRARRPDAGPAARNPLYLREERQTCRYTNPTWRNHLYATEHEDDPADAEPHDEDPGRAGPGGDPGYRWWRCRDRDGQRPARA